MWVELRDWQYRATLNAVSGDEGIFMELRADAYKPEGKKWQIDAAYAAWKEAAEILRRKSFGPKGGRLAYGRDANYTALTAIQKELNYVDAHPALRGEGMYGLHTDIFPVWKLSPTPRWPRKYSSYPQKEHEFTVLFPHHRMTGSKVGLTWWVESLTRDRLSDEALHMRLWRRPIR